MATAILLTVLVCFNLSAKDVLKYTFKLASYHTMQMVMDEARARFSTIDPIIKAISFLMHV
jgi:hypothetical protein